MRIHFYLMVIGLSSFCIGRPYEIPKGLLDLLEEFTTDSTIRWGYNEIKNHPGFDTSTRFSDIRIGTPVPVYYIDNDKLEMGPGFPVRFYIYKTSKWMIPVYGKSRGVRTLYASKQDEKWIFCGSGCCTDVDIWMKFREAWPEETSPSPIIIDWGTLLVHFPEIDSSNLIYLIEPEGVRDNVSRIEDGNEVIRRLSEILKRNKKFNEENPCIMDRSKCSNGDSHEKN